MIKISYADTYLLLGGNSAKSRRELLQIGELGGLDEVHKTPELYCVVLQRGAGHQHAVLVAVSHLT